MEEELGLVCHAPLSVLTCQQNANETSVLSKASLPPRHDWPLVDGASCLREPGHDRPSGGRTPDLRGPRGLRGEWMPPPAGCEWFTEESHLLLCVCVLLLQDLLQSCARGRRRRVEDMCYERRRAEACVDESAHHVLPSEYMRL